MLSVTADNAAANDTMTTHLSQLLPSFGGEPTQTRCFLHIVNLVAKSILKEFDSQPKTKQTTRDDEDDDELDGGLSEELSLMREDNEVCGDDDEGIDDDTDGWVDEMEEMGASERKVLRKSLQPVKIMLVKVSATPFHSPLLIPSTAS